MKQVVFYRTESGNEVVLNAIKKLSAEDRKKIGEDLRVVQIAFPVGPPLCRPLQGRLWEVRSSLPSRREYRLICTYDSQTDTIVVLHGFIKKTQKTPPNQINLARSRCKKLE
jgi:phage-related protein